MSILSTTVCKIVLLTMLTVSQGHTISIQIQLIQWHSGKTNHWSFTYLWPEKRGQDIDVNCPTAGKILDTRVAVGMDTTKYLKIGNMRIPQFVFKIKWSENDRDPPTLRILKWNRRLEWPLRDGTLILGGGDVGELELENSNGMVRVTLSYLDQDTSTLGNYISSFTGQGDNSIHYPKDYKKGKNINFPVTQCKSMPSHGRYPHSMPWSLRLYNLPSHGRHYVNYFGGYPHSIPHGAFPLP